MLGSLLDQVFRRHFPGRYRVRVSDGGPEAASEPEVDPGFVQGGTQASFLRKNVL